MKQDEIEYLADIIIAGFKQGPARDLIRAQMAAAIVPAIYDVRDKKQTTAAAALQLADAILKEVDL